MTWLFPQNDPKIAQGKYRNMSCDKTISQIISEKVITL
jgi:hypothetical protein